MIGLGAEEADPPVSEREQRWRAYLGEIARGDSRALTRLYDECAAALLGLARRVLKDDADAEEILIDAFEQVWRIAGTYDPQRGSVWGWLTLLVRSRALDRLRIAASRHFRDHISMSENWEPCRQDSLQAHAMLFNQERILVQSALRQLPREQREALELAYFSGFTHMEIASSLTLPLGTVKTRIRAGIEKLRACLTEGRPG
jgi:RNA polymerase sigma-70 factor (ECF subfamily)